MIRINKEKIGGGPRPYSEDDTVDSNIQVDEDCCNGDNCQLPEWAADDQ